MLRWEDCPDGPPANYTVEFLRAEFRKRLYREENIMNFRGFPSIEGFHVVVKTGQHLNTVMHSYRGKIKLHGCFSKQTLVTMADGSQLPISEINVGDNILSYDFDKNDYAPKEVTHCCNFDLDKDWIELEFDNGTKIKCTQDHKFFTKNRGWIDAKELNESDIFITF